MAFFLSSPCQTLDWPLYYSGWPRFIHAFASRHSSLKFNPRLVHSLSFFGSHGKRRAACLPWIPGWDWNLGLFLAVVWSDKNGLGFPLKLLLLSQFGPEKFLSIAIVVENKSETVKRCLARVAKPFSQGIQCRFRHLSVFWHDLFVFFLGFLVI